MFHPPANQTSSHGPGYPVRSQLALDNPTGPSPYTIYTHAAPPAMGQHPQPQNEAWQNAAHHHGRSMAEPHVLAQGRHGAPYAYPVHGTQSTPNPPSQNYLPHAHIGQQHADYATDHPIAGRTSEGYPVPATGGLSDAHGQGYIPRERRAHYGPDHRVEMPSDSDRGESAVCKYMHGDCRMG